MIANLQSNMIEPLNRFGDNMDTLRSSFLLFIYRCMFFLCCAGGERIHKPIAALRRRIDCSTRAQSLSNRRKHA
jgi:hypothetical protein